MVKMLRHSSLDLWVRLGVFGLAAQLELGRGDDQAVQRPVSSSLQTGFFLSPLREHDSTGEDFRPTSTREFLDIMKHSTPFAEGLEQGPVGEFESHVPYNFPNDTTVSFSDDGYPTELPSFEQWGSDNKYSAKAEIGKGGSYVQDGDYIVTWMGTGNLSFEGDASLASMNDTNTAIVSVSPKSGVVIRIVDTDPTDPVRNISMIHADYWELSPRPTFHPQFLKTLQGANLLRFSKWQRIDQWDVEESLARNWSSRPQTWHQTQAGKLGVSIEHMVELANAVGANAWFSMPMAATVDSETLDPYMENFATLVNSMLNADLKVYIEYRACCLAGVPPGWSDQENAVHSLIAWNSWESVMDASRIVNTIASLPWLSSFGTEASRVEAAALDAQFGQLCDHLAEPCTEYGDEDAFSAYGNYTAEEVVEGVLWPAMLRMESLLNTAVQQALHYSLEVIAFDALPRAAAGSYKHRGTLGWARSCDACLLRNVGRSLGYEERNAAAVEGWVAELGTQVFFAYQGLPEEDRVDVDGAYYLQGTVAAAKAKCDTVDECKGIVYVKRGEWSCGPSDTHRYGDCDTLGTAYFFNQNRQGSMERVPDLTCSILTNVDPDTDCSEGMVDTYFKADTRSEAEQLAEETAALANCAECTTAFNGDWYTWDVTEDFTLDSLHAAFPTLITKAAEEQQLEMTMIAALRSSATQSLMLHYFERLRLLGFSTVVSGLMHRQEKLCRLGGKECGIASMMTHPDDDGPTRVAFQQYFEGIRAPAVERTDTADMTACAQPCVYGVCELGACRCWERASRADCSVLSTEPRCETEVGISLSGNPYWSTQWAFVDVMKTMAEWQVQEFTSYTWNTGEEVEYRSDGYPSRLGINQYVQVLTLRDIEQHYTSGWYTVLYDGEGVLDFNLDVTTVHRVKPGYSRVYLNLTTSGNNGFGLRITHTVPENPVRNVRIITPGFEDIYKSSPFHPAFKASIERFSILRYMDWMKVNDEGTPWEWDDRPTPDYFTQFLKGTSVEYLVLLANEMAKHPWFTLPTNATDNYFREFATYVKENLRPDVTIYIELGNEVWHPGYFGGLWAVQQGAADGNIGFLCWYAKRTGEMADIFKAVLSERTVLVVGESQASNEDATSQLLACPGFEKVDIVGIAPYFDGYGALPDPESATLTEVMESYNETVSGSLEMVRKHLAVLNGAKKLVTYEAGAGGEGDGTSSDLAIQAHRDPRMKQIVKRYLEEMDSLLDFIVYYTSCAKPSKYGSFALIEAIDQPREDAPKYLAMQEFLDERSNCTAQESCVASDGCNEKGVCGSDDECYCYRGYSGATCLDASYTDYMACGYRCTFDQGLCEVDEVFGTVRSWACTCHDAHSGATCSRFSCQDGCNYRGHCISSNVCSCFRGYQGDSCEVDCGCSHHGHCGSDNKCICDQGYRRNADETGCEWDCDTVDTLGCTGPGQSACTSCQKGTCVDGFCRCWAGYFGAACDQYDATLRPNHGSTVGINAQVQQTTFVDVMKTSREWTSIWAKDTMAGQFSYQGNIATWTNEQYTWGNGQPISQDSDGYITALEIEQNTITLALRDVCKHAPAGRYVVLYDGDGEIDFGMDSSSAAFQKGRIDIDFTPTCQRSCWFDQATWMPYCSENGISLVVTRTNPSNPIRNIKVIMPGFLATHLVEPFHPWYLKHLERFSFIRLMDMEKTNHEDFIKRTPIAATHVRFTSLGTKGGGTPRVAELMLRDEKGALITCSSDEWPEICDNAAYTDWAPGVGNNSVVVTIPAGSEISSYMWITSGWNQRVDPVQWTLETSTDGQTWEVADSRTMAQSVTHYRRQLAAEGSPEGYTNYPLRSAQDLFEWADRSTTATRTFNSMPVALEYQVLLMNTLGTAPWVCVHHLASDDYVREEATYWLNNLRSDVDVFVEHSNEVWNPLFPQGRYATEKGATLGLVDDTCRTTSAHCARVRYNAYRSKQIFDIWKEVWGSSSTRLKLVIATQSSWSDVAKDMLYMDTGATHLGITGYMSPVSSIDPTWSAKSEAEIMDLFVGGIDSVRSQFTAAKALATEKSLGIAVYEGGVGLVEDGVIETGEDNGWVTELLIATGRSPGFQAKVKQWLDMISEELGSTVPFGYFNDAGYWSKYGQWGMREYYDAATATSPAAAAVHDWQDEIQGVRQSCVVANTFGRGLPPDSFAGPPAVWAPLPEATLVAGQSYKLQWGDPERLPADTNLSFYLWQTTSCSGSGVELGTAPAQRGNITWTVPDDVAGDEFFIELRSATPTSVPSNYSGMFKILAPEDAPVSYLLYVANDVDLLSAFHRDCKQDKDWALKEDFKIESCFYSSAEGCRTYRTSRKTKALDGPPPWEHGSGKSLTDCTLHALGIRQTLQLEGLTQGFDTSSAESLAKIVANASQVPEGAVTITINGRRLGDTLLNEEEGRHLSSTVELTLDIATNDDGVAAVAQALATLETNQAFSKTAASTLGVSSLAVKVSGELTTEEKASTSSVDTTTSLESGASSTTFDPSGGAATTTELATTSTGGEVSSPFSTTSADGGDGITTSEPSGGTVATTEMTTTSAGKEPGAGSSGVSDARCTYVSTWTWNLLGMLLLIANSVSL